MVNTASGLFTVEDRKELPLDGVHVAVRIVNLIAEVQVVQFYVNDTDGPIDCLYEFPMDENAAVCGFEVELGDRVLIGEVKKKEDARVEYNEAIARGVTAALLEQDKPDVFVQRIGNIPANSRVNVRILYAADLAVDKDTGAAQFVLPTSVAPRYTPCPKAIPWYRSWSECCFGRRLPPTPEERNAWDGQIEHLPWIPYAYYIPEAVVNRERPGSFSVTIEAEMASPVVQMESRTHLIRTEKVSDLPQDAHKMVASFWNDVEPMGKDLVVNITQEQPYEPSCQLEVAADGSGCAMVTVVPAFELEPKPVEIIFLVDCSGSMGGNGIAASKRALDVFLHSLPLSCHFNIYCFGSSYQSMIRLPRKYSQDSLEMGKNYVAGIDANLGGTEILKPLQKIFSKPPVAARQLFILTDGQVSNTKEVIDLCRKNAVNTRVFTVGIGDEVSRHLVQGMARAGNGTAEFIVGKDLQAGGEGKGALEVKLISQLKLATLPSITKIDVDWLGGANPTKATPDHVSADLKPATEVSPMGSAQTKQAPVVSNTRCGWFGRGSRSASPNGTNEGLQQAPFLPPPLFSGSKFVMYCFLTKDQLDTLNEVRLTAEVPGGMPMAISIPVKRLESAGRSIQLLAARALVRDLSEQISYRHWVKKTGALRSTTFNRFSSWAQLMGSSDTSASKTKNRGSALAIVSIPPSQANDAEVRKEMVDIGIKYGIVSEETSFIAVEGRRDGSKLEILRSYKRNDGFHCAGFFDQSGPSMAASGFTMSTPSAASGFMMSTSSAGSGFPSLSMPKFRSFSHSGSSRSKPIQRQLNVGFIDSSPSAPTSRDRSAASLVSLQKFDGSFNLSSELAEQLGCSMSDIEANALSKGNQILASYIKSNTELTKIWTAVLFLKVLEVDYPKLQQVWELSAEKTRSWLKTTLETAGVTDTKTTIAELIVAAT